MNKLLDVTLKNGEKFRILAKRANILPGSDTLWYNFEDGDDISDYTISGVSDFKIVARNTKEEFNNKLQQLEEQMEDGHLQSWVNNLRLDILLAKSDLDAETAIEIFVNDLKFMKNDIEKCLKELEK